MKFSFSKFIGISMVVVSLAISLARAEDIDVSADPSDGVTDQNGAPEIYGKILMNKKTKDFISLTCRRVDSSGLCDQFQLVEFTPVHPGAQATWGTSRKTFRPLTKIYSRTVYINTYFIYFNYKARMLISPLFSEMTGIKKIDDKTYKDLIVLIALRERVYEDEGS